MQVGHTPPQLTLLHERLEHGHGLLDGRVGVHAVHVVQVDVVRAQARQGLRQLPAQEFLLTADLQPRWENSHNVEWRNRWKKLLRTSVKNKQTMS